MKIVICGLNGSGKTTLAKKLAELINYKHMDIEDYYFVDNEDYKYKYSLPKEEVVKKLEMDFDKYDNIIFSACKGDYGKLKNRYDFAIFIRIDKENIINRVKERSFAKFGNKILENGDLYESEKQFFKMVYQKDESEIIDWFYDLKCDKMEIDGLKPTDENIKIILSKLKEKKLIIIKKKAQIL